MREIKFRGKVRFNGNHYHSGQFVFGDYIEKNGVSFIFDKEEDQYSNQRQVYVEVAPKTVGQFTGLKDKNGVEIYEGDIVRWDNGHETMKATVGYSDACFDLVDEDGEHGGELYLVIDWCEVVSNVHEEPK